MTAIPREQMLALADLNLAAYLRHATTHARGGAVEEDEGLIVYAGGHPNPGPYINGVLRLDPDIAATRALERAYAFFTPRRRSFAVWIRDHADGDLEEAVQAAGFWRRPPPEGQPGIVVTRSLGEPMADGAEIRRVASEAEARDFLRVVGDAWGMLDSPEELVWAMFLTPEAVLAPEVAAFVAYERGEPAGGSMTYVAHGVAGLYWGARRPSSHGRGLGTACALACINAGLEMGARFAAAQSSLRGTPLWVSLGFEVVTHYRRYVSRPAGGPSAATSRSASGP